MNNNESFICPELTKRRINIRIKNKAKETHKVFLITLLRLLYRVVKTVTLLRKKNTSVGKIIQPRTFDEKELTQQRCADLSD